MAGGTANESSSCTAGFEEAIIANADLSSEIVLNGLRRTVEITRREKGIFDPSAVASIQTKIQATLDRQATELQAQQLIMDLDGLADKKCLNELLLQRIARELRQLGNPAADNIDEVEYTQAMILVQHPDLLHKAQRKSPWLALWKSWMLHRCQWSKLRTLF